MPVFEQKLISPLAVRFTQEHIRTTFKDGRPLEESYKQITTKPGTGDYDLLLEVPFPNIEIIRWHVPRSAKEARDKHHWFTLDNRRLYCMQRAAMAHWPQRVGVVVDLLYADPGSVWKKFDSSSRGQSVTIGHSARGPTISKWDWIWEMPASCEGEEAALQAITDDDERQQISALRDAQEEPSSLLDLALAGAFDGPEPAAPEAARGAGEPEPGLATPSTADSSEEAKAEEVRAEEPAHRGPRVARWAAKAEEETKAEVVKAEEPAHRGPRVARWAAKAEEVAPEPEPEKDVGGADWNWNADDEYQDAANEAAAEVERQLRSPGNKGFVWVTNWNEWYLPLLGTLRSFIESYPDRFIVHPGWGRGYTVSLVDDADKEDGKNAAQVPSRGSGTSASEGYAREDGRTAAWAPYGRRRPGRGGFVQKKWVVAGGA